MDREEKVITDRAALRMVRKVFGVAVGSFVRDGVAALASSGVVAVDVSSFVRASAGLCAEGYAL